MPKTLAFELLPPRAAVLVHGRENPSEAEWNAYIDALAGLIAKVGDISVLVVTDGGGPNSVQRTDMNDRIRGGNDMRGAVVTESRVARGIVTALSWFNAGVKAFPPVRLRDALRHLGLDEAEQAEALAAVRRLRDELGLIPYESLPTL